MCVYTLASGSVKLDLRACFCATIDCLFSSQTRFWHTCKRNSHTTRFILPFSTKTKTTTLAVTKTALSCRLETKTHRLKRSTHQAVTRRKIPKKTASVGTVPGRIDQVSVATGTEVPAGRTENTWQNEYLPSVPTLFTTISIDVSNPRA